MQDLRVALRSLRQHPIFAAVGIVTLGLGIGATTAMLAVVNATLYRPLPFAEPDRLMIVNLLAPDREAGPEGQLRPTVWSYPKYETFLAAQRVFDRTALYAARQWSLTGTGRPERLQGEIITADYLRVLGVRPSIGRDLPELPGGEATAQPIALLAHSLWVRRFNQDPAAVGRTIAVDRHAFTIGGILPPGFTGLTGVAEIWLPLGVMEPEMLTERWSHSYTLVGRLAPGTTDEQAASAAEVLGAVVDRAHVTGGGQVWSANAERLDEARIDPSIRNSVVVLTGAVTFVLLIACVNLASLLIARATARQHEFATRLAIGAGRWRVVRLQIVESLVLSVAGGVVGLLVAAWGVGLFRGLARLLADGVFQTRHTGLTLVGFGMISLDRTALATAFALAVVGGVAVGLLPALGLSRISVGEVLRQGGAGAGRSSRRTAAWTSLLVAAEIALSVVLLAGAGLMLRSLAQLRGVSVGFDASSVVAFRVSLPAEQYDRQKGRIFFEELLARIGSVPGVASVGQNQCAPLSSWCNATTIRFPDRPPVAPGSEPGVGVHYVSPGYFATLRIPLLKGRLFTDNDGAAAPKVILVNLEAARRFWPGEDPVGKRAGLGQFGFEKGATVVGVVGDVRYGTIDEPPGPDVYLPVAQLGRTGAYVFVRSHVGFGSLLSSIRHELQALDPDVPLIEPRTLEERTGLALMRAVVGAGVLGAFAAVALGLAAIGVFGTMSWQVERRRKEIGIRVACGADAARIVRLVLASGAEVTAGGLACGLAGAFAITRVLRSQLYEVTPSDPTTFVLAAVLLVVVALFACYLPARRASRDDPVIALRSE